MVLRFPCISIFAIAFPSNKILEFSTVETTIQDLVNNVDLLTIHYFGRWWRGLFKSIIVPRAKVINMEDRVNFELVREFELIVKVTHLFEDSEGA